MKISKCNVTTIDSTECFDQIKNMEELKDYFSQSSDLVVEDVKFEENTTNDDPLMKYIIQVLYHGDDGYWTVGYSNKNNFE